MFGLPLTDRYKQTMIFTLKRQSQLPIPITLASVTIVLELLAEILMFLPDLEAQLVKPDVLLLPGTGGVGAQQVNNTVLVRYSLSTLKLSAGTFKSFLIFK